MNHMFKNIPEPFAGVIYFACGAIILLDAMHAINAGLLVVIGAFFLMWHGFVLLRGPKHLSTILERLQRKK